MRILLVIAIKELRLLVRNPAGLVILFLMPSILVIIITLVQENVLERTGLVATPVLFLDQDRADVGRKLVRMLERSALEPVIWEQRKGMTAFIGNISKGRYPAGVVVAKNTSARLERMSRSLLQGIDHGDGGVGSPIVLRIYFDPAIMPGLRAAIRGRLENAVAAITLEAKLAALEERLGAMAVALGLPAETAPVPGRALRDVMARPLVRIDGQPGGEDAVRPYDPVRQNVLAWAIFGIFFIALPVAGTLVAERSAGIMTRMATLPVSMVRQVAGKALAYLLVSLCQFALIYAIGVWLFPLLGLGPLRIAPNLLAGLVPVLLCIGLAACSYGVFLGMVCASFDQVSTIGSTTIVAGAALGGIMVPVHVMPETMRKLSMLSPLSWGLRAGQDLLARDTSLASLGPMLGLLVLFALLMFLLAGKYQRRT